MHRPFRASFKQDLNLLCNLCADVSNWCVSTQSQHNHTQAQPGVPSFRFLSLWLRFSQCQMLLDTCGLHGSYTGRWALLSFKEFFFKVDTAGTDNHNSTCLPCNLYQRLFCLKLSQPMLNWSRHGSKASCSQWVWQSLAEQQPAICWWLWTWMGESHAVVKDFGCDKGYSAEKHWKCIIYSTFTIPRMHEAFCAQLVFLHLVLEWYVHTVCKCFCSTSSPSSSSPSPVARSDLHCQRVGFLKKIKK